MIGYVVEPGLYELERIDLKDFDLPKLEWIAADMGLDVAIPMTRKKARAKELRIAIATALGGSYCFYIPTDRHYWVINGLVWYTTLGTISKFGTCQSWNTHRGALYLIPEAYHKVEQLYLVAAESYEVGEDTFYFLETLTTDPEYCETLKDEVLEGDFVVTEDGKYFKPSERKVYVAEALPCHLQFLQCGLDPAIAMKLDQEGYPVVAYHPDERVYIGQAGSLGIPGSITRPYMVFNHDGVERSNMMYKDIRSAMAVLEGDWIRL